jgi:hypothetical protein
MTVNTQHGRPQVVVVVFGRGAAPRGWVVFARIPFSDAFSGSTQAVGQRFMRFCLFLLGANEQ